MNTHTTTLLEIRRFLAAERAAPAPWTEPAEALESLYALLVARKDDPVFWARLGELVRRLEDHRVNLSRLARSEAFGHATVEKLLGDLRADLGRSGGAPSISWRQALSSSLRATSLAALLVLGAATAACDSDSADSGLCSEASEAGVSGDDAEIYCDLVGLVQDSDLTSDQKADLLDCLPSLDAEYREYLLNAFQSMSDADVSDYLQDMLNPCGECNDEGCH